MINTGPCWDNLCAIIVTFHPDSGFPERLARIASQVPHIVVVDNGSPAEAIAMIKKAAGRFRATILQNPDNLGIATALNQGIAWAIEKNHSWALTFDQDTEVDTDFVPGLRTLYEALHIKSLHNSIGMLAPCFRARYENNWRINVRATGPWIAQKTVITSGSLMSLAAYAAVGRFRDDFFIDMVDNEYCLRLRSNGYHIYMTTKPLMSHAIGAKTAHRLLWRKVSTTNHSALRRYYIARNRITLARMYFRQETLVVFKELKNMLFDLFAILLLEQDKKKKACHILEGITDGLLGHMGKKPD